MTEDAPADAATELGASITETEAVTAWALDDGEEWEPRRRLTPGRITAAAVAASLVAVSVTGALAWQRLRGEEPAAESMVSAAMAPVTTTTPAAATPSPVFNGKYRIVPAWDKTAVRDNKRTDGGTNNWVNDGMAAEWIYAFTSGCSDTACVATGTLVDELGRPIEGGTTVALKYANGVWEDMAPSRVRLQCTYTDDGTVAGAAWLVRRKTFVPRPDGSFRGDITMSVESDGCGDQGNTAITPFVAARIGGVPSGLG